VAEVVEESTSLRGAEATVAYRICQLNVPSVLHVPTNECIVYPLVSFRSSRQQGRWTVRSDPSPERNRADGSFQVIKTHQESA
jgi:hypothetical protein